MNQKARVSDYMKGPRPVTDRVLFAQIASGNEQALNELYERYRSQVFRFLIHQTGDREAAEELLQDVFMAAWQGAGNFRGTATVKTWLLRVAYYRAASWVKSIRRTHDLEAASDLPAPSIPMDDRMIRSWKSAEIHLALGQLTHAHRTAIDLLFYHELTYREAAAVVGCPVGTMKSRVNHALKNLNGLLLQADVDEL